MRNRALKMGLVAATAISAALPLLASPAFADYAPGKGDVVGVGSDTLQDMLDFMADGTAYGPTGYNQLGNTNKLVSFDATADFNVRLAYGVDGGQPGQSTCTPGTGTGAGTANSAAGSGAPCVLNPTIVLRAGQQAVQRPNGSGAGFTALVQDIVAGNNTGTNEVINFSRASAGQSTSASLPSGEGIDQLTVATDTLPMIEESPGVKNPDGTTGSNAVPLNAAQLDLIYTANTGSCIKWNDPRIGGTSSDAIIPIIPQVGSGTRKYFLQQIGDTALTVGSCASVGEENDPTAIAQQAATTASPGGPADAISPVAQGRLDLFKGVNNTGADQGIGGYFLDPSCPYQTGTSACGTGTVASGTYFINPVAPQVQDITGTPVGTDGGGSAFDPSRNLYLYFRSTDVASTTKFQPGGSENWVNSLFYNPSGVGGAPYIQTSEGQLLLKDAGVTPVATETCLNITTNTPC